MLIIYTHLRISVAAARAGEGGRKGSVAGCERVIRYLNCFPRASQRQIAFAGGLAAESEFFVSGRFGD